jgi:hypothetical protein
MQHHTHLQPGTLRAGYQADPMIAYVYGDTPPDFAAIAGFGFEIVCLDRAASWYRPALLDEARRHGLRAVTFTMGYPPGSDS